MGLKIMKIIINNQKFLNFKIKIFLILVLISFKCYKILIRER